MTAEPPETEVDQHETPALLAADAVLFPEMEVIITIGDSKNIAAANQAFKEHNLAVLIPTKDPDDIVGSIGTLAVLQTGGLVSGTRPQTLAKGLWRVRVRQVTNEKQYFRVKFTRAGEDEIPSGRSGLMKEVFNQIDEFVRLMPGIPSEIIAFLKSIDTPGRLADVCAFSPFFTLNEKIELLRTINPEDRLATVNRLFSRQLSDLKRQAAATTIEECPTCIDLADRAFNVGLNQSGEIAREFLDHVVREHPDELLIPLASRYGPAFLRRRALK